MESDAPPTPAAAKPLPLLLSDVEAARLLGCSRATVHRLRAAGKFPDATRLGRKLLFNRAELESWVQHRCPDLATWKAIRERDRRLRIAQ
jgi:excisionase family DNA binding protein